MKRQLVIHSGPHKTATTYIQNMLRSNASILKKNNIEMGLKPINHKKHRMFTKKMNSKNKNFWTKKLKPLAEYHQIVISTESFANNLLKAGNIEFLQTIAKALGRELNIVYFVRDQTDLINSQYCHGIRRFYRSNDFNDFLHEQLERDSSYSERGYNLDSRFSQLSGINNLKLTFIPLIYNKDPFQSMAEQLQWPNKIPLKLDNTASTNSQPGSKGIWLSRMAYDVCKELNHPIEKLKNRGNIIRQIAFSNQWTEKRFYGFNDLTYNKVREFYEEGNNRFARIFWGKNWDDMIYCKQKVQEIYRGPSTESEQKDMETLLLKAFRKMGWKYTDQQRMDIQKIYKNLA